MALLILALAWPKDAASARLILIGIGRSSMAAVGARFIVPFSEIANVQRAMIWLAGSLWDSRWAESRRRWSERIRASWTMDTRALPEEAGADPSL